MSKTELVLLARRQGNEFFKKGDYLSACVQYIDAIDIQGPRPVLSCSRIWLRVITKYHGAFRLAQIFLRCVDSETCLCSSRRNCD
jgi:hypothetical protein